MTIQFIGLIILLLLSGFFSSTEFAYVLSNKIKIEIRARKNNLAAKNALYFVQNPRIFFSTILISNNIVNIAFASLITVFLVNSFQLSDYAILFISTILLLLFGELIPKYFARETADSLIAISVIPVRIITIMLYPIVKVLSSISKFLTTSTELEEEAVSFLFEKEDIRHLLEEGSEAGSVGVDDYDIIKKIIDLSEIKSYETMTPRTDIVGVDINSKIDDVINTFIDFGYSKLPVYEENLDNIKGIVFAYDMFKMPTDLRSVMREVSFVPETKKILELLNEFLEKQASIAIVVDEFGGTAGIATLEDIIEEMFGEIRDEYDLEDSVCKEIDKNIFVISGKVEIDFLNDEHEMNIPEGDYETIGGYITTKLGRIPVKGEKFKVGHFRITVLHSDRTKINLIKLFITPEQSEEG